MRLEQSPEMIRWISSTLDLTNMVLLSTIIPFFLPFAIGEMRFKISVLVSLFDKKSN